MKKRYVKLFSILMLIAIAISSGTPIVLAAPPSAPLAATVTYTADNPTTFANPERGFHNRYEIINDATYNDYVTCNNPMGPGCPPADQVDRTFARAKALGNTIIHSYIHLDKYQNVDLPQGLLDNLSTGLAAIRTAGLKIIVRPAYAWSGSPTTTEAQIMRHIDQLNAVISANADVIQHLETGYLGPWGEWHTSQFTASGSREYADVRYRIVKHILSTTPTYIPLVIRYPIFIHELEYLTDTGQIPAGTTALTQTDRDRIGFHNDCFLATSYDMGTYDNDSWMGWFDMAVKIQWMYDLTTSFNANKMVGGETCDSNGTNDAAGVTVQAEMSKLHFTEINEDYAPVNTDLWRVTNLAASGNDPAETAFVRLKRKMGYRLRLIDATFPTSAPAGSSFTISANLNNDGYVNVIKPRPIYLVLDNGTSRFNIPLSAVDIRNWKSGAVTLTQQSVTLPANMTAGTYTLALWMPDNITALQSRPEYSIRLANTGTWNATKGYNVLSNSISITGGCAPNCPTNTPGPTSTNTPLATATPTRTNTPAFSPLMIDSFADSAKWSTNHLNDLNKSVSWTIGSAYYNNSTPGDIVLNSSGVGEYYQETITQNLSGLNLVLRLRDWGDNGTEAHWNVVLNDGTDHAVSLGTYANVTGSYTDFNIPLSVFGANLANSQYVRIVHKDTTYAVLLIDSISIDGGAGPTSTPGPTNTPLPPISTSTRTSTPVGPTNTSAPLTSTPTRTNTSVPPTITSTPTKTNTPLPPTATPTAGAALMIDSFPDANKWSSQHLNDLNKSVSWVMDSIYYGTLPPGEIVMNSSPVGQYYQETITQTLAGRTTLVLRLRDWSDTDTENHWNIVLNDGTDHTVALNTYGNVTGSYANINIPLSAFGANLANVQYLRVVHKDLTYAVLMIDSISVP